MKSAAATVIMTVEASREKTFLHIVPIDLTIGALVENLGFGRRTAGARARK